jgi:hypothetical protein
MEYKELLGRRRRALYTEWSEARQKYFAAVKEARARRARVNEISARLTELDQLESTLDSAEAEEVVANSGELGARLSAMILHYLEQSPDGFTLDQLSRVMGDIKKSTLSATLYNLKKREAVEHIEATGRYRLIRRPAAAARGQPR